MFSGHNNGVQKIEFYLNFVLKHILPGNRNIVFVNSRNTQELGFPFCHVLPGVPARFCVVSTYLGSWGSGGFWFLTHLHQSWHLLAQLSSLCTWSLAPFCTSIHWDVYLVFGPRSSQVTLCPDTLAPLSILHLLEIAGQGNFTDASLCHPGVPIYVLGTILA